MSPLPPILHVLAAAVGVWGALTVGAMVAPDLPTNEPGVIEAQEGQVVGPDDPQSLLQPGRFGIALGEIENQLGADETIESLVATPNQINVKSTDSGDGVSIDDISTSAPYLLAYRIADQRKDVDGVEDLRSVTFHATPEGGVWTAILAQRLRPPHAYRAVIPADAVAFQVHVTAVPGS